MVKVIVSNFLWSGRVESHMREYSFRACKCDLRIKKLYLDLCYGVLLRREREILNRFCFV